MANNFDNVKSTHRQVENESYNDLNSISGGHGCASICKLQPIRVKALLDMDESDDDDNDDKDKSSLDDKRVLSNINETQSLHLNDENLKSNDSVKQIESQSANVLDSKSKELNMEIITEKSERHSISRESLKNLSEYFTPNIADTNIANPVFTTATTVTSTVTLTSSVIPSNTNHQFYDKPQEMQPYTYDTKRLILSKELFHDERSERKMSIVKSSVAAISSDFGATDLDAKAVKIIGNSTDTVIPYPQSHPALPISAQSLSRSNTYDSVGQKCEEDVISNPLYVNKQKSNIKFETVDSIHHDKHIHTLSNYKSESVVSSSSKYDMPVAIIQNDMLPCSINHLSINTPHEHDIAGNIRTTPSVSHRNIFQTPQNKIQRDCPPHQSYAPTPGTIFSHWSQSNVANTPMQNRITDSSQTPGKSILFKNELDWYKNKEIKGVRRPLAETSGSDRRILNDKSSHALKIHDPEENVNCIQFERIPEKILMPSVLIQESKENRRPSSFLDNASKKDELPLRNKISEIIQENHNVNTEVIPKSISTDIESLRENYNKNPLTIQNKTNVQASVPSNSMRKPDHGKVMRVKDREYMILGYLGQGMSGEVVRVQDLTNLELRAIKCVDLSRMDKDSAQSCIHEITMLGKLQAPCVVQMFDYEIRKKTIYVVMEMGDTDLSKFLKSISAEKRLPLTMILYYWTEMLTAVKHIHDNGVIHSDLKPANFLLVRGRLKLIDFGIASSLNADMTSIVKNSTVGTLNYISPEALMDIGESPSHNSKYKISYKSDVWSLGCILYSLVFGHTPFQHIRQQWAKVNAITNPTSKISFAQSTNSEPIPSILIDVVRRCLQHDPKARPSVAQLLEIRYVPIGKQYTVAPNIPSNILLKIKCSLNDDEWRQFIEVMDHERKNC